MSSDPVTTPFTMPFGKHKGKPLDEIPADYLTWCLTNVDGLYPETRRAINEHLKARATPTEERAPEKPAQREPRRDDRPTPAACVVCGLPGSSARPLVHASCATDEAPF